MNRARKAMLLLAAIWPAGPAAAQIWTGDASIGVQVTDRRGHPLADAEMHLTYRDGGTASGPVALLTDDHGRAAYGGLAAGSWNLEIRHPEHLTYVAAVVLRPGQKAEVTASFLQATGEGRAPLRVKLLRAEGRIGRPVAPTSPPPVPAPTPAPPEPATPPAAAEPAVTTPPRPIAPELPAPREAEAPAATPEPTLPEAEAPPVAPAPVMPATPAATAPPVTPEPARTEAEARPPAPEPVTPAKPESGTPPRAPAPEMPAPATAKAPPVAPEPATPEAEAPPPAPEPAIPAKPESGTPPRAPAPEMPAPAAAKAPPVAPEPTTPEAEAPPAAPAPAMPAKPETGTPPRAREPEVPAPEMPAAPAREISPTAPETAPAPPAVESGPPPAAAPQPLPQAPPLRSYRHRTCAECKPDEWAAAAVVTVPGGGSACPATDPDGLRDAVRRLADAPAAGGAFAGQAFGAVRGAALERAPLEVRERMTADLARFSDPASRCGIAAVALPAGARFVGFRYEAFDEGGGGDCLAGTDCPIGEASWPENPAIVRGATFTVIYSIFDNRSSVRPRSARLTAYYRPESGAP